MRYSASSWDVNLNLFVYFKVLQLNSQLNLWLITLKPNINISSINNSKTYFPFIDTLQYPCSPSS